MFKRSNEEHVIKFAYGNVPARGGHCGGCHAAIGSALGISRCCRRRGRRPHQSCWEKNAAFMRGDMEGWAKLARIAPDFTLMQPFGGPASHGYDTSPKRLAELAQYFRNGTTKLEVAQTYASERLVVLVMIEQQHAEVGGLPDQDWSLRVTEVYRRDGSEWQLAHRHADPLVHRITLEQAAALRAWLTTQDTQFFGLGHLSWLTWRTPAHVLKADMCGALAHVGFGLISETPSSFEPLPCEQEVVERLGSWCHTLGLGAKISALAASTLT